MEEKNVKLEFKKIYIDTAKHAKDIEKWINSGKRKQGDIRRSIKRLELKYKKLSELKKIIINNQMKNYTSFSDSELYNKEGLQKVKNELELQKFENELAERTGMSLHQIENKINELYILSGLKSKKIENRNQSTIILNLQLIYLEMKMDFIL